MENFDCQKMWYFGILAVFMWRPALTSPALKNERLLPQSPHFLTKGLASSKLVKPVCSDQVWANRIWFSSKKLFGQEPCHEMRCWTTEKMNILSYIIFHQSWAILSDATKKAFILFTKLTPEKCETWKAFIDIIQNPICNRHWLFNTMSWLLSNSSWW